MLYNIRHWLHVLELVAWFCSCASDAGYEDGSTGAVAADGSMEVDGIQAVPSATAAVFSKAQAYALLVALQELQTSYGAHDFLASACSSSAGATGEAGIAQLLQSLKVSLLGVLCASLVADNTERCADKTGDHAAAKTSAYPHGAGADNLAMSGYSYRRRRIAAPAGPLARRQRGVESDLQQTMAYEYLTGAHMDL